MDATCACLRISYAPVQIGFDERSGSVLLQSRWSCDDCGTRFAKEDVLQKRIEELEADLKIKNALIDRAISACSMYRDQPIFELLEHDMRKAREERVKL